MRSPKPDNSKRSLQKRIERLEREVRELRRTVGNGHKRDERPWWQQIAGDFEDDPVFAEIVRLGRKIRRAEGKGSR
jgi:hypothetical protein